MVDILRRYRCDYGYALAIDSNKYIYLTGSTSSPAGIATSGSHQTVFGGGAYDAFLAKFVNCVVPDPAGQISG